METEKYLALKDDLARLQQAMAKMQSSIDSSNWERLLYVSIPVALGVLASYLIFTWNRGKEYRQLKAKLGGRIFGEFYMFRRVAVDYYFSHIEYFFYMQFRDLSKLYTDASYNHLMKLKKDSEDNYLKYHETRKELMNLLGEYRFYTNKVVALSDEMAAFHDAKMPQVDFSEMTDRDELQKEYVNRINNAHRDTDATYLKAILEINDIIDRDLL
jgi:hypothetical protein